METTDLKNSKSRTTFRAMVALLGMAVLLGMGEHLGKRFVPLYLQALGGGVLVLGLYGALDNLLGALYSFPGGYLAERLGNKRSLAFFSLVSILGYLIIILFPSWQAVLLGMLLYASWNSIALPASMSFIAKVMPLRSRTLGVSLHSLVRRIPQSLGPLLAGFLMTWQGRETGMRLAFACAILFGLVSLAWQQRSMPAEVPLEKAEYRPWAVWKYFAPELKNLLLSDILIRFAEQIPFVFVVVWCVDFLGLSPFRFGVLTAIEQGTAAFIYIPIARLADRGTKKPYVVATFGFFTLFPLLLYFSHTWPMLVLAFVVRGLKEFGEPARKALILDLAPEGKKASVFGLYYLIRDVIVSFAAFGGALLWRMGPGLNLLSAFGFGLAGMLFFALLGKNTALLPEK